MASCPVLSLQPVLPQSPIEQQMATIQENFRRIVAWTVQMCAYVDGITDDGEV